MVALPAFGERVQVEIATYPPTPVQRDGAADAFEQRVFDDRLDGRETGAACEQNDRLVAVLAEKERPERPFEPQDILLLHPVEDVIAERPAIVSEVQLQVGIVVRRV